MITISNEFRIKEILEKCQKYMDFVELQVDAVQAWYEAEEFKSYQKSNIFGFKLMSDDKAKTLAHRNARMKDHILKRVVYNYYDVSVIRSIENACHLAIVSEASVSLSDRQIDVLTHGQNYKCPIKTMGRWWRTI